MIIQHILVQKNAGKRLTDDAAPWSDLQNESGHSFEENSMYSPPRFTIFTENDPRIEGVFRHPWRD